MADKIYKLLMTLSNGATVDAGNIVVPQGAQGIQGVQGPKGDKGDAFRVSKVYASVAEMNAGYETDGVPEGGFVVIDTGNVEDEDNAKLYFKGTSAYTYLTDLSGAQGMKGEEGKAAIVLKTGTANQLPSVSTLGHTLSNAYFSRDVVTNDVFVGVVTWNNIGYSVVGQITSISTAGTNLTPTYSITYLTVGMSGKGEKGDKGDQGIQGKSAVVVTSASFNTTVDTITTGTPYQLKDVVYNRLPSTNEKFTGIVTNKGTKYFIGGTFTGQTSTYWNVAFDTVVKIQGEQGIQGEKGDKGDQGVQGIQGIQGEKGETGAQGVSITGATLTLVTA